MKPKAAFFPEVVAGDESSFYLLGWLDSGYDFSYTFKSIGRTFDKEKGAGGWNGARYSDPDLDKLLDSIGQILDLGERTKAIEKLNRVAMEEKIFVIPLHYLADTYALRKGKGIQFKPRADQLILYKEISKK